jgi:hypothetical protein
LQATNDGEVADADSFADRCKIGHEDALADHRSGIEDDAGPDNAVVSDHRCGLRATLCHCAVRRTHGLFADNRVVVNTDVRADPRAGVYDHVVANQTSRPNLDIF